LWRAGVPGGNCQAWRAVNLISLEWLPDPDFAPPPETPELRATLEECGSVQQMFSREELEVFCEQLDRQSVIAKINLVVQSLQAGLP
jgi:hypothetical protein